MRLILSFFLPIVLVLPAPTQSPQENTIGGNLPQQQNAQGNEASREITQPKRKLTVRITPFMSFPSQKETKSAATAQFQAALLKSLQKSAPNVQVIVGSGGKADCQISGQVVHFEGPDTPFLVNVALNAEGGQKTALGYWSGSAASVFHFSDRMRHPTGHPNGLAGDLAERIIQTGRGWHKQRQLSENLMRLPAENVRVSLLTPATNNDKPAKENESPITAGSRISVPSGQGVRLRVTLPNSRSVVVLGQTPAGKLLPLFVPVADEGAFPDGTISLPLDSGVAFRFGEIVKVWVVVGAPEAWVKSRTGKVSGKNDEPTSAEPSNAPVQVMSALSASSEQTAWSELPGLVELAEGAKPGRFLALSFEMVKRTAPTATAKLKR